VIFFPFFAQPRVLNYTPPVRPMVDDELPERPSFDGYEVEELE
jgi:hypothetical protein